MKTNHTIFNSKIFRNTISVFLLSGILFAMSLSTSAFNKMFSGTIIALNGIPASKLVYNLPHEDNGPAYLSGQAICSDLSIILIDVAAAGYCPNVAVNNTATLSGVQAGLAVTAEATTATVLGGLLGHTLDIKGCDGSEIYRTESHPDNCYYGTGGGGGPSDPGYPGDPGDGWGGGGGGCDYCQYNWTWTAACRDPYDRDYCG